MEGQPRLPMDIPAYNPDQSEIDFRNDVNQGYGEGRPNYDPNDVVTGYGRDFRPDDWAFFPGNGAGRTPLDDLRDEFEG